MAHGIVSSALREKVDLVRGRLKRHRRAALAFSGGADSSLLLYLALDTLGPDNVLVLTARSCLLTESELDRAASWFARHPRIPRARHVFVDVDPLSLDEFVRNPENRCYLCKREVYRLLWETVRSSGFVHLLDGTNDDDMHSDRPGLRALRELGISTPLAEAGLTKPEVRLASRDLRLDTWDHPSASCLATRIPAGLPVTVARMELVARLEAYLEKLGFAGCRARLDLHDTHAVTVQVQRPDLIRITRESIQASLREQFQQLGIDRIAVDPAGR